MKLIILLILVVLLVGCTDTKCIEMPDQDCESDCCQQCLEYANQDPSGYDISIKPCSEYGLDCDKSVGECQKGSI